MLLPVPSEVPTVAVPLPTAIKVVVVELPVIIQFLIVLPVAPLAPFVCNHITAPAVPASVCIKVRSLDATDTGQTVLAVEPSEPSMVTLSAAFILIKAPVLEPVTVRATPVGFIVTVKPGANSFSANVPSSPVIFVMISSGYTT